MPLEVLFTWEAFQQRVGGVQRYTRELAAALALSGVHVAIDAGFNVGDMAVHQVRGRHVAYRGIRIPTWLRFSGHRRVARWLNSSIELGAGIRRRNGTSGKGVVHRTYYSRVGARTRAPWVLTVHDMVDELFPTPSSPTTPFKRECCMAANAIIAVSERTRLDVIEVFGIDCEKVFVASPGTTSLPDAVEPRGKPQRDYLLYVGDRTAGYKNFVGLLRGLAEVERDARPLLFAVGAGPPSTYEHSIMQRLGLGGSVFFRSASDAELAYYYQHALAFVYPSHYEGFGLPTLEAMQAGCPVLAARAGPIPEVVGDAALLFTPDDPAEIANCIERVVAEDALRLTLRANGYRQHRKFTWSRAAEETLAVYRTVL
jgi:glycosyltransferase involved in cell wall biosynthesis